MNYTELKTAVGDFLNRQDLTSVIPTFVELAETDINRTIRHRSMLTRATATLTNQFTGLPDGFLEAKNVQLNSNPVVSLEYVSIDQADKLRASYPTGQPKWYTIVGDEIEVVPVPDASYTIELVYYKKPTPLSSSNLTNWVLDNHMDVYLYGALMHSAPYLKNDERVSVWGTLYKAAIADLNLASDKSEYSGSPLKMKTR